MTRPLLLATALALPALAASAAPPAALAAADRDALLAAACSWADDARAEATKQRCAPPSDLVWSTARPGRFVANDDEWLVSLSGPCIGGCPGVTFVARNVGGRWTKVGWDERLVTDRCVTVRGLADGRDRVACLAAAGPNQGFMTEFLELRDYAEEGAPRQLLFKEHGGECWLQNATARTEYDGDDLDALASGPPGSDTALTVRLTVRRARCVEGDDAPEKRATVRGTHALRFVRRGNDLVQDQATAALVRRYGWAPER